MNGSPTLRQARATAVREHILHHAYNLLVSEPDRPFSHEAIAARAGVGARTIYRYFPSQSQLYEELWVRVRKQAGTIFPSSERQILPQIPILYGGFARNEAVVTAVLESAAGHRVRERGASEGRAAFSQALENLTAGMTAREKSGSSLSFLPYIPLPSGSCCVSAADSPIRMLSRRQSGP